MNQVPESDTDTDDALDDSAATDNASAEAPPVDLSEQAQQLRMLEALLFAATEPLDERTLGERLPDGAEIPALVEELRQAYANRGVNLTKVAGKWAFRTAPDLHFVLQEYRQDTRRLSRAALETLAIIAYHQPITRAEIEEVRGVGLSKGTLDMLIEIGWVRMRGRRRTPGRPVTYGVTDAFLEHFGFESVRDLPGIDELKAAGLLEGEVPPGLLAITQGLEEDPLDDDDDGTESSADDESEATAEVIELSRDPGTVQESQT
jgi:segregation and condensation protein B